MAIFAISDKLPEEVFDNGTARMGGGVHCPMIIGCLTDAKEAALDVATRAVDVLHSASTDLLFSGSAALANSAVPHVVHAILAHT